MLLPSSLMDVPTLSIRSPASPSYSSDALDALNVGKRMPVIPGAAGLIAQLARRVACMSHSWTLSRTPRRLSGTRTMTACMYSRTTLRLYQFDR